MHYPESPERSVEHPSNHRRWVNTTYFFSSMLDAIERRPIPLPRFSESLHVVPLSSDLWLWYCCECYSNNIGTSQSEHYHSSLLSPWRHCQWLQICARNSLRTPAFHLLCSDTSCFAPPPPTPTMVGCFPWSIRRVDRVVNSEYKSADQVEMAHVGALDSCGHQH